MENATQTSDMEPLTDEAKFKILEDLNFQNLNLLWPAGVFLLLLAVGGLVGNVLVLLVYWRKFPASTTRLFILSLAAVDLMSCVLSIPGELVDFRFYFNFPDADLCRFFRFNNAFTSIGSGVLILPMAADRYRRICRPMQRQMTHLAAKVSIACSLLVSFLLASPFLALSGHRTVVLPEVNASLCTFSDHTLENRSHVAFLYIYFFVLLVCFVVLIVLYSLIGVQVWRRKRFQSGPPLTARRAWRTPLPPPAPSTDTCMPSESDSSARPPQEAGGGETTGKGSWRQYFLDKFGKKPRMATARFYTDFPPPGSRTWVLPGQAGNHSNSKPLALTNRAFVESVYECEDVRLEKTEAVPNSLQSNEQHSTLASEQPPCEQKDSDIKSECPSCGIEKANCVGCDIHQPVQEDSAVGENSEESCKQVDQSPSGDDGPEDHEKRQEDRSENNNTKVTFADVDQVRECETSNHYLPEMNGHAGQTAGLELVGGVWKARYESAGNELGSAPRDNDAERALDCEGDSGDEQSHGKQEAGDCESPQRSINLSHVTLSDSECWSTDEECLDTPRGSRRRGDTRDTGTQSVDGETPTLNGQAGYEEKKSRKSLFARLCPCLARASEPKRPSFPIRRSISRPVRASRTTLILFFIALVFILSYLPFLILMVLREMYEDFESNLTADGSRCYNFFLRTFFINAASNPIIYSFLNVRFRRECRKLLTPSACWPCC